MGEIKMPLFSIIVPIYNVESYLRECIDSILNQTCQDFELIFVNDGSTDDSLSICLEYASKYNNICVIDKENGGLVSARKSGMEVAKGEYILNVDSDDFIDTSFLTEISVVIKQHNPDMIALSYQSVTDDGKVIDAVYNDADEGYYTSESLEKLKRNLIYDCSQRDHNIGNIIYSIWSKVIRRSVAYPCQMKVPNILRNGEDIAVVMPAMCSTKSLYITKINGYFYRQRSTSMVHTFDYQEFDRYRCLLEFLHNEVMGIPEENINGYGFRIILGQIVKAARHFEKYSQFRDYIKTQYQNPIIYKVIKGYKQKNIMLKRKIRIFALKYNLWYLLWFFYHR